MKNFIVSALPFVIVGICIAILAVNSKTKTKKEEPNYLTEGMSLGMCFGVAFASTFDFDMGLGIGFGMLIGETIGCFIKK